MPAFLPKLALVRCPEKSDAESWMICPRNYNTIPCRLWTKLIKRHIVWFENSRKQNSRRSFHGWSYRSHTWWPRWIGQSLEWCWSCCPVSCSSPIRGWRSNVSGSIDDALLGPSRLLEVVKFTGKANTVLRWASTPFIGRPADGLPTSANFYAL